MHDRMKPFLAQVAELFYRRYGAECYRLAFVFPNRRAGLFFQKYLADVAGKPLFSPTILTINDLFGRLSGRRLADRIAMLFSLYEVYQQASGSDESLEDFLYWGEMLLNDFDDVDKYLVDARALFTNVTDWREIEDHFDYLSEEQVEAIRAFWSSFRPREESASQRDFRAVWQILFEVYTTFKAALAERGEAYEGMMMREVVERMANGHEAWPFERIIFVGLNALSVAEERLLALARDAGVAEFYWDYASPKTRDKNNRAAFFATRNLERFPSAFPLEEEGGDNVPKIETVGIPSGVGQAKWAHEILARYIPEGQTTADPEMALRTAVVLPDERLLMPVLRSIPEAYGQINVTMGYPLAETPVAALMERILSLQKNIRQMDGVPCFYHQEVMALLNHPYIQGSDPIRIAELAQAIIENNRVYIPAADLDVNELARCLFRPVLDPSTFLDYLLEVLSILDRLLGREATDEASASVGADDLGQEYIFHYFTIVNRLKALLSEQGASLRIETYYRLLTRLASRVTIPFEGEPLAGLQVMGVLETRALDFDRLIILSMNEGTFPLRRTANSFIPHNLRKGFGLPTYEHQDSVWAYHFYRLIHRASEVTLLYDTRSAGTHTGEVSRFVTQLRYLYATPIASRFLTYRVNSEKRPVLLVEKDESIQARLARYLEGGGKALSASALNTYLDCPLKFYFTYIEDIEDEEAVTERVESDVFGSIFHKVMEELYRPLNGARVTADLLELRAKDEREMTEIITRAFATEFFKSERPRPLVGRNYLIGEMIRKYVKRTLEIDARFTPFLYRESERRVGATLRLTDGRTPRLKGFIDRIDEVGGFTRIVDYKTGRGTNRFASARDLFDASLRERPKAVMQVYLYAWMLRQSGGAEGPIAPSIYFIRDLFGKKFDASIQRVEGRGKQQPVGDLTPDLEAFEDALRDCVDGLFDPRVAFAQAETDRACGYCPFATLCGR